MRPGTMLPATIHVIERGWLSSNNILFLEGNGDVAGAALIDTGYAGQAQQTLTLVKEALNGRSLNRILNTHSHSDHIGGNAALQAAHGCEIIVPDGIADMVARWDEHALLLTPACQRGERFAHDATLKAGDEIELGGLPWKAIAAPGHDMHALMLHCPTQRLLITGDALWEDGFGVVFNELMAAELDAVTGADVGGFAAARKTLDAIQALDVLTVIPGHGSPFADVPGALLRAFSRLALYEQDKKRLGRNAVKACFTFNLLDFGRLAESELASYVASVPFFAQINHSLFGLSDTDFAQWLLDDLQRSRAVTIKDGWIVPLMAA